MTRAAHRGHVDAAVLDAIQAGDPLPHDVAHRFQRVLRLQDGAAVELFDGTGRILAGTLAGGALTDVVVREGDDGLPALVVAQAVTKTEELELVIKKGTELGASRFLLVDCARGQVHLGDRAEKRVDRLLRVADDAARQCGRVTTPSVEGPVDVTSLALQIKAFPGVAVVGVVGASAPLSEALAGQAERGVLIVVGPEGGFDPAEIARLVDAGAVAVRLGVHVLRTETAALAALATVHAVWGDFR